MKCALFNGFASSALAGTVGACVGKNLVMREKRDCCGGGGRFRMDFPGTGRVTADEEGGPDVPNDEEEAIDDVRD